MNLASLMKPASIAVVGASQRMTRATRVVANLQRFGYAGTDPLFGPAVVCGFGGIFVEQLRDVSLRVHGHSLRALDINPLLVLDDGHGVVAVDWLIELA